MYEIAGRLYHMQTRKGGSLHDLNVEGAWYIQKMARLLSKAAGQRLSDAELIEVEQVLKDLGPADKIRDLPEFDDFRKMLGLR